MKPINKRMVIPYKYYILDVTNIQNLFIYKKGFITRELATEARDAYLGPDIVTQIVTGKEVQVNQYPIKRAAFSIHSPKIKRNDPLKARINNQRKRERLKGKSINTSLFKRQWEPLPESPKDRAKARLKDRDRIRNNILKP